MRRAVNEWTQQDYRKITRRLRRTLCMFVAGEGAFATFLPRWYMPFGFVLSYAEVMFLLTHSPRPTLIDHSFQVAVPFNLQIIRFPDSYSFFGPWSYSNMSFVTFSPHLNSIMSSTLALINFQHFFSILVWRVQALSLLAYSVSLFYFAFLFHSFNYSSWFLFL